MDKLFKIVCEGNTDMAVFKEIIPEFGKLAGKKYKVEELFPPNKTANAGWPNLKAWCQHQAAMLTGTINAQRDAAAILLGLDPEQGVKRRNVDLITAACKTKLANTEVKIVVQLDSDIVHDLFEDAGKDKASFLFPLSPADRIKICEDALDSWLGPHVDKKGVQLFYCVNHVSLENWILTRHSPSEINVSKGFDYDLIQTPDLMLIGLGYSKEKNSKGGVSLKKSAPKYKLYGKAMAQSLKLCVTRSSTLKGFKHMLDKA